MSSDAKHTPTPHWWEIWQVPALVVSIGMLGLALAISALTEPTPNFDRLLYGIELRIEREQYDEALDLLNKEALPYVGTKGFSSEHLRQFHVLRARAIFHGQHSLGVSKQENYQAVISEYLEAERRNAALIPSDTTVLARSLIEVGLLDRALERAIGLPEGQRERKVAIKKQVVIAKIGEEHRDEEGALALLTEMLADPRLDSAQRVWAIARRAELLIEGGYHDEAIAKLLRSLPRLPSDVPPEAAGELSMLLGRAYLESGLVSEATKHLDRALGQILPGEAIRGEALVLLGHADEQRGALREAQDRYVHVIDEFGGEPAVLPALHGLARVQAKLSQHDQSRKTFQQLVDTFKERIVTHHSVTMDIIGQSLLSRAADRLAAGRTDQALELGLLAEDLYGIDDLPDDVIRALAESHRRMAEEKLGDIGVGLDRVINLNDLDPATRETARRHFIAAGSYFSMFADRVTISDNEEYADALWYAADSFDAGGDRELAIQGFHRYAIEIPGDPRQPEAKFRLAQAYQARGDYDEASKLYLELINAGDDREGGRGVGPYAQASFVPLAQTYLRDMDASNDDQAEDLLRRITDGTLGTGEASYFREGLIELGKLYYGAGRYVEAIEKFEDAIARYPDESRMARFLYLLADSYRLESENIALVLQDAMPDHERRAFEAQRRDHLRRALELYDTARRQIEGMDPRELTGVDREYLRNAYFYIGASAFDLGDYVAAIAHYNTARERFPKDPSSLVAMIQIVHAHLEQGQLQSARTANERAKRFYESLPPEVWDNPSLPMRRADWERWLDLSARLDGRADAGK